MVLDTGSADTWIDPDSIGGIVPPNVISTGMNSTTTYLCVISVQALLQLTAGMGLYLLVKSFLRMSLLDRTPLGTRL